MPETGLKLKSDHAMQSHAVLSSSGLWTLWMLHVSMSSQSLPGYARCSILPSICRMQSNNNNNNMLYANMCLRIVCAWLRHAFIRRHLSRWWRCRPRRRPSWPGKARLLAYQVAIATLLQRYVACHTLPVCLAHDLFLLRHSDNSNAICVSHRLYSLHVSFSTFMPPFLPGYFWHVAATAATAAASSDCLVVASIFNAYVNNPLLLAGFAFPVFASLSKQISLIILHKLCAQN